jgi:hypothetical protein
MSRNIGIKDQAPGQKLAESFILCGHQAISIAVLLHSGDSVKLAHGKVTDKGSDVDMTRLESGRSFLPVKASMTMREKLCCIARSQNCFLVSTSKKFGQFHKNKEQFGQFH